AEDGIRDRNVTGVQTCALPICCREAIRIAPNPHRTDPIGARHVTTTERRPIRRALVSVFDKTGIVDLARALHEAGAEIVSTGSTGATIREAGLPVTDVDAVTGFPEIIDGRVKPHHPRVHGGILADQHLASHRDQLAQHEIAPYDLVVVNLYPFEETVEAGGSDAEIIEKIDIGGPSMVRGAAKNHASVAVV